LNPHRSRARRALCALLALSLAIGDASVALAQTTPAIDLSDLPLSTLLDPKPNVMIVLDDSGAMNEYYLPDNGLRRPDRQSVAFRSAACNSLYFDPNGNYDPPFIWKAVGGTFVKEQLPQARFLEAPYDGYDANFLANPQDSKVPNQTWTAVNLATHFQAYDDHAAVGAPGATPFCPTRAPGDTNEGDCPARAYYFEPKVQPVTDAMCSIGVDANGTRTNFIDWRYSAVALDSQGNPTQPNRWYANTWVDFERRLIDPNDAVMTQKFANWYAYYRRRGSAMKSALLRALVDMPDRYRVGFTTLQNTDPYGMPDPMRRALRYSALADLSTANKAALTAKLLPQLVKRAPNYAPLAQRSNVIPAAGGPDPSAALAAVGRHFARNSGWEGDLDPIDPTIASCGRNYAVLTSSGTYRGTSGVKLGNGRPDLVNEQDSLAGAKAPFFNTPGSTASLSDVAYYYYNIDLKTGQRPPNAAALDDTEDDVNESPHLTTFTIGFGLGGNLAFDPGYKRGTSADFNAIRAGTKNWPLYNPSSAQQSQAIFARVDDLWHAAVNGRGTAFFPQSASALERDFQRALAEIGQSKSAGAGAAITSAEPVPGKDLVFLASYTPGKWTGDLEAMSIDLVKGANNVPAVTLTPKWSAAALLNGVPGKGVLGRVGAQCDTRDIRLSSGGKLIDFKWRTDACDATTGAPLGRPATTLGSDEQTVMRNAVRGLSQFAKLTPAQQTLATGDLGNLVNYLRGQSAYEETAASDANRLYRARASALGDIVGSRPVYVKQPFFQYPDTGYQDFKSDNANRLGVTYVAANDGMLHAFRADDGAGAGQELWAIIPSTAFESMGALADFDYAANRKPLNDGAPVVGDICREKRCVTDADAWRTIVVAGLGKGGRGYYAIDVTDPAKPELRWEFRGSAPAVASRSTTVDKNLGYTYGNPIITKLGGTGPNAGRWVVIFASGYQDPATDKSDGRGYLYVLDAWTGEPIKNGSLPLVIDTGVGDAKQPSGLAKISAAIRDPLVDNTVDYVYGGDLLGNLWRFDVNGTLAPTPGATLLGTARDDKGVAQPITVRPELARVRSETFVYVGTGRLLGKSDLAGATSDQLQTVYAVRDALATPPAPMPVYADLRTELAAVRYGLATRGGVETREFDSVVCAGKDCKGGWFMDLKGKGERVLGDLSLQLGGLYFVSSLPSTPNGNDCGGGKSYFNFVRFDSGKPLANPYGAQTGGIAIANSLAYGPLLTQMNGTTPVAIARPATPPGAVATPWFPGCGDLAGKRVSWRELAE
jgi:Tfp pilus tip-associated adhesin PilY1